MGTGPGGAKWDSHSSMAAPGPLLQGPDSGASAGAFWHRFPGFRGPLREYVRSLGGTCNGPRPRMLKLASRLDGSTVLVCPVGSRVDTESHVFHALLWGLRLSLSPPYSGAVWGSFWASKRWAF